MWETMQRTFFALVGRWNGEDPDPAVAWADANPKTCNGWEPRSE